MAAQDVMRWQLDVPQVRARELDEFSNTYGFATRKDLMNTALSLLQWAVDEVKGGRIIASVDEASMRYKQLDLPAFKIAASQAIGHAESGVAKAAQLLEEADELVRAQGTSQDVHQKIREAQALLSDLAAA